MKHADQFFSDSIEACRLLGQRGILLTQHPEQLPAELPKGIQHFAYLPFSEVLPRALALVHHGGIGTTAHAIAAGIPQVIRPMAHDQPDTAARVEKLGIGASLVPKKFSAASLTRKLNTFLVCEKLPCAGTIISLLGGFVITLAGPGRDLCFNLQLVCLLGRAASFNSD
jgi:UDP:flavonoid glycosyltransferase YjiC (YdhE family)